MLKPGDQVVIYHDPISARRPEGAALIEAVYGQVARWHDHILYRALVRFTPDGPAVYRDVRDDASDHSAGACAVVRPLPGSHGPRPLHVSVSGVTAERSA